MVETTERTIKTKAEFYTSDNPDVLGVDPAGIPESLKKLPRWVLWGFGKRDKKGKLKKEPMKCAAASPKYKEKEGVSFYRASSTDPNTWTTFDEVMRWSNHRGVAGIGICMGKLSALECWDLGFDPKDNIHLAGSDFDECFQENWILKDWAAPLCDDIVPLSYVELSPSCTGLKGFIFVNPADIVITGSTKHFGDDHIELYHTGRYMCITGHRYTTGYQCNSKDVTLQTECYGRFHALPNGEPVQPATKGTKTPKQDTKKIAESYLADHSPHLVVIKTMPYHYTGTHYTWEDDLDGEIRKWLMTNNLPHSNLYVSNVSNDVKVLRKERSPMPFWKQPSTQEMIPFKNGLFDMTRFLGDGTIELIDHTADYVCDFCLPYDFDPEAKCDLWLEKLGEILEQPAKIELLQQWFGYCFTSGQEYQKMLLKVGVTRSGKGLTDSVLGSVVGSEYCCGLDLHKLASPYGCAKLVGMRVGLIGEVHLEKDHNKYVILERLKNITGGDLIDIERTDVDAVSLKLPIKLSISANDMPQFFDASGALAARLLILGFNRSFELNPDETLLRQLLQELPGIALWALRGLKSLNDQGYFTVPEESKQITRRVRREGSPILAFLQDCCEVSRSIDTGNLVGVSVVDGPRSIQSQTLRDAIAVWGLDNDITPCFDLMIKNLNSVLPKLGEPKSRREGNLRYRLYDGISLTSEMDTQVKAWVLTGRSLGAV